jgi:hypothetical protein
MALCLVKHRDSFTFNIFIIIILFYYFMLIIYMHVYGGGSRIRYTDLSYFIC